jgi:hypothetical protein
MLRKRKDNAQGRCWSFVGLRLTRLARIAGFRNRFGEELSLLGSRWGKEEGRWERGGWLAGPGCHRKRGARGRKLGCRGESWASARPRGCLPFSFSSFLFWFLFQNIFQIEFWKHKLFLTKSKQHKIKYASAWMQKNHVTKLMMSFNSNKIYLFSILNAHRRNTRINQIKSY